MFAKSFKLAAVALVGAIVSLSSPASAAVQVLTSGDTVGGWAVVFPAGISLIADNNPSTGAVTLKLEKGATFTSLEGLVIRFVQKSFNASQEIAIVNESVTNLSGTAWGGFDFIVTDQNLGNNGNAKFKSANDVFKTIDPFSNTDFSNNVVSINGGSLANGATGQWGFDNAGPGSGGDLVILARPSSQGGTFQTIDFKEQPFIPLPAAAWSGLSGLIGLGLIGYGKNFKKLLA
jgi:hypothetical protein